MSSVPLEIQEEIMKRLPVRSLLQFRSLSKAWKSLIDSSDFITHYYASNQLQHLLVRYLDPVDSKHKFVSIVDDDTFPQQKVPLAIPMLVDMYHSYRIIGISHGLLCLYGHDAVGSHMAVVWNPSVRKSVGVVVPNVPDMSQDTIYEVALGFWACGETSDLKIVKITYIDIWTEMDSIPESMPDTIPIPSQVEVFTLSTGAWRSPYSTTNLPRKSLQFDNYSQVVIDGSLYWLAMDCCTGEELLTCNLIISFDMISEEFKQVSLPHSLAHRIYLGDLHLSKLRNSLVVLQQDVVWIMEDAVQNSFTKLYAIRIPDQSVRTTVVGFRKTGEPVIEYVATMVGDSSSSNLFNNVEISGMLSFYVYAYTETLLLLDQPDSTIYNQGKRYILQGLGNMHPDTGKGRILN
ncbi:putative F-box domain-containing protein [Helianthus annuus]|nr:putative F-box domain-containing protein [Helianthus annuus]